VPPDELLQEIRQRAVGHREARARRSECQLTTTGETPRPANGTQGSGGSFPLSPRGVWSAGRRPPWRRGLADVLIRIAAALTLYFVRLCVPSAADRGGRRDAGHGLEGRFPPGWKVIVPRVVGSQASRSFRMSTVFAGPAAELPFSHRRQLPRGGVVCRGQWSHRPFPHRDRPSSCSAWPRIMPRRAFSETPTLILDPRAGGRGASPGQERA